MLYTPDQPTRESIKFWIECLQGITVIIAIISAVTSYRSQVENTKRELSKSYEDKKLELYLDAARTVAHLATRPDVDRDRTEARFWELYWGELAFVESKTRDESGDENKMAVEHLMVNFCNKYFADPGKCTSAGDQQHAAIELSHQASGEIRDRWESLGR